MIEEDNAIIRQRQAFSKSKLMASCEVSVFRRSITEVFCLLCHRTAETGLSVTFCHNDTLNRNVGDKTTQKNVYSCSNRRQFGLLVYFSNISTPTSRHLPVIHLLFSRYGFVLFSIAQLLTDAQTFLQV